QLPVVEVEGRGEGSTGGRVRDKARDQGLRGPEDGVLQVSGNPLRVLLALLLDFFDGWTAAFPGQKGFCGKQRHEGRKGDGVVVVREAGQVGLQVGAAGAFDGGADEADPLTTDEEPVWEPRSCQGLSKAAHGVGSARATVQVFFPRAAVSKEQRPFPFLLRLSAYEKRVDAIVARAEMEAQHVPQKRADEALPVCRGVVGPALGPLPNAAEAGLRRVDGAIGTAHGPAPTPT